MNLSELINKVEEWSESRNIISGSTILTQVVKLVEEAGELADSLESIPLDSSGNINYQNTLFQDSLNKAKDSIGDILVLSTNVCLMSGKSISELISNYESNNSIKFNTMRFLFSNSNKLLSVCGKLCALVARGKFNFSEDDYSNSYIDELLSILSVFSVEFNTSLAECLSLAYDEIKDRKGLLIDGFFIKESDLSDDQKEQFSDMLNKQ